MTELILSLPLLVVLICGAGWILKAAWERGKCATWVFENARSALSATPLSFAPGPMDSEETPNAVVFRAFCGGHREQVGLRKLESMHQWN